MDYFSSLPPELIIKIMAFCHPWDLPSLSLTCKTMRSIYKHKKLNGFIYCIEKKGNLWPLDGLRNLLKIQEHQFNEVKILNCNFPKNIDIIFKNYDNIFGKPFDYYLRTSYAVKNVDTITIIGSLVSDYTLVNLTIMFPNMVNLNLVRCYLCLSGDDFIDVSYGRDEFSPINKLTLTLPFLSDKLHDKTFMGWLLDSFIDPLTKLSFEPSPVHTNDGFFYTERIFVKKNTKSKILYYYDNNKKRTIEELEKRSLHIDESLRNVSDIGCYSGSSYIANDAYKFGAKITYRSFNDPERENNPHLNSGHVKEKNTHNLMDIRLPYDYSSFYDDQHDELYGIVDFYAYQRLNDAYLERFPEETPSWMREENEYEDSFSDESNSNLTLNDFDGPDLPEDWVEEDFYY